MSLQLCRLVDVIHYLLQEEIHQEASPMIPLVTRASNSSLVSPSTPRNTGGTEHEMENDGRDNDSVSPDHDTNVGSLQSIDTHETIKKRPETPEP